MIATMSRKSGPNAVKMALAALAAAAGLAAGGCALMQEKTIGQSLDEASADAQIKTRLAANGGITHFGEVDVAVEDRFVLLSGRVPSEADKAEAEKIAWSVQSIDEVANELMVEERHVAADVNDLWIDQQVRARFLANKIVNSPNYRVRVYRGTVYLLGVALSEDELREAAEVAARVGGVKKVVSYVKVRGRPGQPSLARSEPAAATPAAAPAQGEYQDPAPIVAAQPSTAPAVRPTYADPYAPGAAPPPGARSADSAISSAPMPLVPATTP